MSSRAQAEADTDRRPAVGVEESDLTDTGSIAVSGPKLASENKRGRAVFPATVDIRLAQASGGEERPRTPPYPL